MYKGTDMKYYWYSISVSIADGDGGRIPEERVVDPNQPGNEPGRQKKPN